MVEQLPSKQKVIGSSPVLSKKKVLRRGRGRVVIAVDCKSMPFGLWVRVPPSSKFNYFLLTLVSLMVKRLSPK